MDERSVAPLTPQRKVSRNPRGSAAMTAVLRCLHSYLATQPPDHQSPLSVSVIPPILAPRPVKRTTPSRPVNTASSSCTVSPPARPPSRTERRFACAHAGCEKACFKPSRLAEHALTHTGVRPHQCLNCEQTYIRASHLHAHLRTHLPEEARNFGCTRDGCEKKFWTASHLKRHEGTHDAAQAYACESCPATFSKTHLLRDHVVLAHHPPGTKAFPCPVEGCTSSFALRQHLRAHGKTHDSTRYTCSHPSHGEALPSFPVWSTLQAHLHKDHPPTCPHEKCRGRVFKSGQRLREHLKVHAQQEADLAGRGTGEGLRELPAERDLTRRRRKRRRNEVGDEGRRPKIARLVDGNAGKEYECEDEGCEKRFKTRFALKAHCQTAHLGIKAHTCPHDRCDKSYAHKSNLDRHIASYSRPLTTKQLDLGKQVTGEAAVERRFGCPEDGCRARFWRVYDVRRHISREHGLELQDPQVRILMARNGEKWV